ncbi:MAG: peptidoglycan-binding protein, partial [Paracoccaceae bacterium]|nr:peptidoglycan-binding protein [Paracoccaceae bacterium]
MRGFLTTSALVMAMAAPAVADDAAFLLGVSRYDNYDRVARATSILGSVDGLKDQGFEIFQLGNGDWTDVRRNLRGFAAEAEDASRLVVILAGQFVTDGNQTWLVT